MNIETDPVKRLPSYEFTMLKLQQYCLASDHPYLREFASSPLMQLFLKSTIMAQSFGSMSGTRLRKELLEAAALEARLRCVLAETNNCNNAKNNENDPEMVIWDLCCGKGFGSLWLRTNTFAVQNKRVSIHMVDNNPKINYFWLEELPNMMYYRMDIYAPQLETAIGESCKNRNNPVLILFGIHTCGDLSRRVLQLGQIHRAYATLVCPCCCVRLVDHPKQKLGSFGYDTARKARGFNNHVSVYQLWCWMLWGSAQSYHRTTYPNSKSKIDLRADPYMKTDKNIWLTVVASDNKVKDTDDHTLTCP